MDTDNVAVENVADTTPPLSVGKTLREARISQGLSVADVASSIKFAPRQVEALEADDYTHLPELAFVRGFVRSYARLLHVDETSLLNELPLAHQKLTFFQEDMPAVPFSVTQSNRRVNVTWLSGALGLAVVLGLGVWLSQEKSSPKKETPDTAMLAQIEPMASAVAAVAAVSAVAPASLAVSAVAIAAPSAKPVSASVKSVSPSAIPGNMALPTPKPASTAPATAPVAGKLTQGPIHLVFEDESWVDVKDKFGKTIFKQINPAKSEQWIAGRSPFSLVIGNASGVRLYYEGEEIDLEEFTDVEVARLILE